MEIIKKIIPKNPIDSATMKQIGDRVQNLLKVFGKNYALQTTIVIVNNKERQYEEEQIRKAKLEKYMNYKKRYYKKKYGEEATIPEIPPLPQKGATLEEMTDFCNKLIELGFKPVFPRGKIVPLKPPELKIELKSFVILEKEFDPYAAYEIKISKGNIVIEKERRFKEFEKLNKALKKLIPKTLVLPPASSKVGIRNLNEDFLNQRVTSLNNYLQEIIKIKEVLENKAFLQFTGLYEEDPLDVQIFEAAFKATKYELRVWGEIKYDDPSNAMSKLLIREIWKEFGPSISASLPNVEAARKSALKLAYKVLSGTIDSAIPPVWKAAYEASKKVRVGLLKALDKVIGLIIKTKNDLNNKLKEFMMKGFLPVKDGIAKLFSVGVHKLLPPLLGPFAYIYKTYSVKAEPLIIEALRNCDQAKMKEGTDQMIKIYESTLIQLNEKMNEPIGVICDELIALVTFPLLQGLFSPLRCIGGIIGNFIRIINPENFSRFAISLFEYKNKLIECNGQGVDSILEDMETHAHYVMDNISYVMNYGRYGLRNNIYGLGLSTIAEVCFDLGRKLIKQVYRKSCKKFYRKFSDYVYGFSKKEDDSRPWREKVDEAFILAYQAAKHKFNKECGNVLKRFTCDVLGGVIINDLITKIVETVGNLIGTLTSQVPDEVKEMINLEEMAKDDVRDILTGTFEGAVYDQNNAFEEELNKAIENCQI